MKNVYQPIEGLLSILESRHNFDDRLHLTEWVGLRLAQIHGCSMGRSLYVARLRQAGVPDDKLADLERWPVSPGFNERERVALGLAEVMSKRRLSGSRMLPRLLHVAGTLFAEKELVELLVPIEAMQEWHLEETYAQA